MIVTIDGPSGTGKSTVARLLAKKMHFSFYDTGALYRSVAWWILQNRIALDKIQEQLPSFCFRIEEGSEGKKYFVHEEEVTSLIRSPEITALASKIAALKEVREALLPLQRLYAKEHDSVFEGRDLGTVVFPLADIKVFLTAKSLVRAKRRYQEMIPQEMTLQDVLESIEKRDRQDSQRDIAPLKCPDDAFVLDTSDLSIDQVVDVLFNYILTKKKNARLAD